MPRRRWSCVLGLGLTLCVGAASTTSVRAARAAGDEPFLRFIAGTNANAGEIAMRAGDAAMRDGDFARADKHYRAAWEDQRTRSLAADRLSRLHAQDGFVRPLNESQLQKAVDLLGPGFIRHETEHFVLLSDAPRSTVTLRAELLERAHLQFFRVMDRLEFPALSPEHKLLCVFFATHREYSAFARSQDGVEAAWIAGYYAGVANRVVFYDDSTSPAFNAAFEELRRYEETIRDTRQQERDARRDRNPGHAQMLAARADDLRRRVETERLRLESEARQAADAKTIHEAVHLLAFNCSVQSRMHECPFWLTEGLASTFETDRPHAAFGPDRPTPSREKEYDDLARQNRLLPLATLVTLARVPEDDSLIADVMYAQSHALYTYLYRYHRRALGQYMLALRDEPAGASSDRRRLEIFESHFGSIGSLEARMLKRTGAR